MFTRLPLLIKIKFSCNFALIILRAIEFFQDMRWFLSTNLINENERERILSQILDGTADNNRNVISGRAFI